MAARKWLIAFLVCCVLVVLCVAFVDRPLADYSREIFGGTDLFQSVVKIFVPMEMIAAAVILVIAASAVRLHVSHRDIGIISLPIQSASAAAIAIVLAGMLKVAIGRSQVYPSYIVSRIYEFHPFHGGTDYQAFPSATMSVTVAVAAVLWNRRPRLRWLWTLAAFLQISALLITNGHWLADIVGGVFLGALVGWWVVTRAAVSRRPT